MKRFLHTLVLLSLLLSSCDSISTDIENSLPLAIEKDFSLRYPDAAISHFEDYSYDNTTIISFEDKDGLRSTAIYLDDVWMMTQKEYWSENELSKIPSKVGKTYLGTGVEGEEFLSESDFIAEISRNGFEQKLYEFHFHTPLKDENGFDSHLVNNILISEDGSLLTFDHFDYNRSIWWYDIRDAYRCVAERYPSSSMLGAVNFGGNNIFYINDNGILKKVTTRKNTYRFEWVETQYQLDIDTTLPEAVEMNKKAYESQHPERSFFKLSFVENTTGCYYRLSYGSELNCHYLDVDAE